MTATAFDPLSAAAILTRYVDWRAGAAAAYRSWSDAPMAEAAYLHMT